jgi:acid phosphatase class B
MKTIVSALIALSLVTAIAAPASAFDSKEFFQQQDRSHY